MDVLFKLQQLIHLQLCKKVYYSQPVCVAVVGPNRSRGMGSRSAIANLLISGSKSRSESFRVDSFLQSHPSHSLVQLTTLLLVKLRPTSMTSVSYWTWPNGTWFEFEKMSEQWHPPHFTWITLDWPNIKEPTHCSSISNQFTCSQDNLPNHP